MLSESDNYLERIEDLRRQIKDLLAGLPAEALNWRPIVGKDEHITNSLAVLAVHTAGAEHYWIGEVIGRLPAMRDREAEFNTQARGSAELEQLLEKTGEETRKVFASLTAEDLESSRQARDRIVPVRWGILHVIDHTALHLGHMQLTYQLWMGGSAKAAPLWYQRLPSDRDSGKT